MVEVFAAAALTGNRRKLVLKFSLFYTLFSIGEEKGDTGSEGSNSLLLITLINH